MALERLLLGTHRLQKMMLVPWSPYFWGWGLALHVCLSAWSACPESFRLLLLEIITSEVRTLK